MGFLSGLFLGSLFFSNSSRRIVHNHYNNKSSETDRLNLLKEKHNKRLISDYEYDYALDHNLCLPEKSPFNFKKLDGDPSNASYYVGKTLTEQLKHLANLNGINLENFNC